jgi:3-oxoacyl-[acyl-carrier-protein] synthase II
MQSRRVVITGLGPVTCFGIGIDPLWQAMLEGRTGIAKIRRFDPDGFECRFAGELSDEQFTIRDVVPKSYRKATKVMCRDIELAVAAADAAVRNAGLTTKATDPDAEPTCAPHRVGCQIGAGLIAADVDELTAALVSSRNGNGGVDLTHWGATGMQNLTPLWLLKYLPNMLACHVTIIHDCHGPSNTITCCEASSGLSLGESVRVIARGGADVCLTGGAEFKINPMAIFRQICAKRLAHPSDEDEARRAVRPFAPDASGTIIGEGGGIIVLEAIETAEMRGAMPLAEVAGFASTQSHCRYSITFDFDPDDPAMSDAMELAMEQAGVKPDQIDAIVPFGSGIANVDQAEAAAIRRVFGERAASIPIITTIPNTGNCNAGNGAVALSVAVRAMKEQKLPARLNTHGAQGLDADACESRDAELNCVLAFSTSQGGQNAAIVLKRV